MTTTTPDILKETLRSLARDAGLPLFGVCPPLYPEAAKEAYAAWIAAERHADLRYLATRRDITGGLHAVLPAARSVIVVGYPYGTARGEPSPPPPKDRPFGRVSLYAQGRDYHRSLETALKPLLARLGEEKAECKWAVDYGPFCERTLGQQAGLGFLGRNGCLINPTYGSYFFLAAVATSLALPFDAPLVHEGCGACRRCQKACPTGALDGNGQLDCRLCLAYHTIENKNELPPEVAAGLGRRLIGCDQCQRVCPYNRPFDPHRARLARLPAWLPLDEFMSLSEEEFRARYSGTALMRPGYRTLLRNARLIAAQSAAPENDTTDD